MTDIIEELKRLAKNYTRPVAETRAKDGRSVTTVQVDEAGDLIVSFDDGTQINAGVVVGPAGPSGLDGRDGSDGKDGRGVTGAYLDTGGQLVLRYTSGPDTRVGKVVGPQGPKGVQGISVANAEITSEGVLELRLSSGTVISAGRVVGADGIGISDANASTGDLIITLTDGRVINAGRVKGEDGISRVIYSGGGGGAQAIPVPPTGPAGGDLTGTYPDPNIAPLAVTNDKIAIGAVDTEQLAANAVDTSKIADGSVVTSKIPDKSITTAKLADATKTWRVVLGAPYYTTGDPDATMQEIGVTDTFGLDMFYESITGSNQWWLGIRKIGALSVLGNAGTSFTRPTYISSTAPDQVFRVNSAGNALSWGAINLASNNAVSGVLAPANGGFGANLSTASYGSIPISDSSSTYRLIPPPTGRTTGRVLMWDEFGSPNWSLSTFADLYPTNSLLYAASSQTITPLPTSANAVLAANASSIASFTQTLPDAVQRNITKLGAADWSGIFRPTTDNGGDIGSPSFRVSTIYSSNIVNSGSFSASQITVSADPTNPLQVATKQYVDTIAAGLSPKGSVKAATTVGLSAVYNNGASGFGATLTNSGSLAALVIDGVSLAMGNRVLVKDQATQSQNGIYTVTQVGSASVAWVLTRASDYDTPAEIKEGTYTIVDDGTVNSANLYIMTTSGTITIGSSPIVWNSFNSAANITAGTGISKSGNTISNSGVTSLTGTANQVSVSASSGAVTLSLPQNIATSSNVTFGNISPFSNNVTNIGSASFVSGGSNTTNSYNNVCAASFVISDGAKGAIWQIRQGNFWVNFFKQRSDSGGFNANPNIYFSGTDAGAGTINFAAQGVGAPTFTTSSVGSKIILYPQVNTSNADYAIGIDANTLWYGVPTTSQSHKWYHGTTNTATMSGSAFTISVPTTINATVSNNVANFGYLAPSGAGTFLGSQPWNVSLTTTGAIVCGAQVMATSDSRVKTEIKDIDEDALKRFDKITPKQYLKNGVQTFGYIAQDFVRNELPIYGLIDNEDMQEVIDGDGFVNPAGAIFTLDDTRIIPFLHAKINILEKQLQKLKEARL